MSSKLVDLHTDKCMLVFREGDEGRATQGVVLEGYVLVPMEQYENSDMIEAAWKANEDRLGGS